jgi:hypothetical protein
MIGRYCGRAGANADPDHFGRQATPSIWKVSLSRKATLSRGSFAMLLAEDFPRAQPRLRLASNPVGSERMGLERPHPFKRPVWPFGFDGPSVAVSENDMEYRLCGLGRHGLGPKRIADPAFAPGKGLVPGIILVGAREDEGPIPWWSMPAASRRSCQADGGGQFASRCEESAGSAREPNGTCCVTCARGGAPAISFSRNPQGAGATDGKSR